MPKLDRRSKTDREFELLDNWTEEAPATAVLVSAIVSIRLIVAEARRAPENLGRSTTTELAELHFSESAQQRMAAMMFWVRRGIERSHWKGKAIRPHLFRIVDALMLSAPPHVAVVERVDALVQACYMAATSGSIESHEIPSWQLATEYLVKDVLPLLAPGGRDHMLVSTALACVYAPLLLALHQAASEDDVALRRQMMVRYNAVIADLVVARAHARRLRWAKLVGTINIVLNRAFPTAKAAIAS